MKLAVIVVLIVTAASSHATWAWMRGSAVSEFQQQDWDMLNATVDAALDDLADGETATWFNERTGNGGSVTPVKTFTIRQNRCRRARFKNETRSGKVGQQVYHTCKVDEEWKLISASEVRLELEKQRELDENREMDELKTQ